MKTLILTACVLLSCNLLLMSQPQVEDTIQETVVIEQIEILSDGEGRECHSGGPGATSCSINAGVQLDLGVSGGCSVSCESGYYACCGFHCECKKY